MVDERGEAPRRRRRTPGGRPGMPTAAAAAEGQQRADLDVGRERLHVGQVRAGHRRCWPPPPPAARDSGRSGKPLMNDVRRR